MGRVVAEEVHNSASYVPGTADCPGAIDQGKDVLASTHQWAIERLLKFREVMQPFIAEYDRADDNVPGGLNTANGLSTADVWPGSHDHHATYRSTHSPCWNLCQRLLP